MYQEILIEDLLIQYQDQLIDFIPNNGNIGDIFIYASTLYLFDKYNIKYNIKYGLPDDGGDVLFVGGGGNLVDDYDWLLPKLESIHNNYKRIIILPHTINGEKVKNIFSLFRENVIVLVREKYSYEYLNSFYKHLENIYLCKDLAFNFPCSDYAKIPCNGVLNAYRVDGERTDIIIPKENIDLSDEIDIGKEYSYQFWELDYWQEFLETFLTYIARYKIINTNRLHVAIAGSLMGRIVNFFPNSYYKNQGVYEFSLINFANTVFFFPETFYQGSPQFQNYLKDFPEYHSNPNPKVSIVIPCYNEGIMILEALNSAINIENSEIIIVNDGSIDEYTILVLKVLTNKGYLIINQKNSGLSSARNTGINVSQGEYILPLDADNKILPEYVEKAISIFEADKNKSVVYSNPILFNNYLDFRVVGDFYPSKLLYNNYIDACAVIRKDCFVKLGGYDEQIYKKIGYEDWELWVRLAANGYKFHYLPDFLYYYRVKNSSMSSNCSIPENRYGLIKYIVNKHNQFYNQYSDFLIPELQLEISTLRCEIQEITENFIKENTENDLEKNELKQQLKDLIRDRDEWKIQYQITTDRKIFWIIKFLDYLKIRILYLFKKKS